MKCAKKGCANDAIEDEVYCEKHLMGLGGTETRLSGKIPVARKKVARKKAVKKKARK